MDIESDSARVSFPPPLAFLGTLLAGLLLDDWLGEPGVPLLDQEWTGKLGWVAVFAGVAILMTAIGLFRRAGTEARPWKRTSAIVTDGVYRWTRNPMYLGMMLIYAGIAMVCDSLVALLLAAPLFVVITREVIEREEAYLSAKFGDEYLRYCTRVRRWF